MIQIVLIINYQQYKITLFLIAMIVMGMNVYVNL